MQLPKRAAKLEWDLNTAISLITLGSMCVGGLTLWINNNRDVADLAAWRDGHEALHKERLAEVKGIEASFNERLKAGEVRDNDFDRKLDNLTYRVTVAEQSAVSITSSIKDLQAGQNKQAADIQVVKEILQRMEAAQRRGTP
ncbi:hypothetical protein [Rhizobium sp. SGZ-381]|uniref:hypothetical protein n=1 Tax=Rhizobium sp. SGZ-381 TaxID=3342800 RepID=UPI00367258CF